MINFNRIIEDQKKKSQGHTTDYKCNICKDTGMTIKKVIDEETGRQSIISGYCKCRRDKIREKAWIRSGLNPNKTNMTLANFRTTNATSRDIKRIALEYLKNFDKARDERENSLAMLGQVGAGKSHITIAIGIELIKRDIDVIYMPYVQEIIEIKRNTLDQEYYTRKVNKLKKCDVLLIDDLFKGNITEADKRIIFEIINFRYSNNKPVVISSERDLDELLEIDEAIGSRIYEMAKSNIKIIKKDKNLNYRYTK